MAIGCHRGGHVSHDQAVPVVKLFNWEELSPQRNVSVKDQVTWNLSLKRFATRPSICVDELCRLTAMFSLSLSMDQTVFVQPEIF